MPSPRRRRVPHPAATPRCHTLRCHLCTSHTTNHLPCHAAVESGAEIDHDATGTGSTPMHIAAGFGSYDVVNYLYSVKPDSIEVGLA